MRLCLGHPKVHFGTIVEGSWVGEVGGGGGEGKHVGPPDSLINTDVANTYTSYFGCRSICVCGLQ